LKRAKKKSGHSASVFFSDGEEMENPLPPDKIRGRALMKIQGSQGVFK
jgi:hypothetical protein